MTRAGKGYRPRLFPFCKPASFSVAATATPASPPLKKQPAKLAIDRPPDGESCVGRDSVRFTWHDHAAT